MNLDKEVNKMLKLMHQEQSTAKGSFGEKSVLKVCEGFYASMGGILIHSYMYQPDNDLPGNIHYHDDTGGFTKDRLPSSGTEIDVLYVSPYRIFPIEVKAYKAKKITLTDDRILGCYKTDKSPVHQNEMHCRHLYSQILEAVPNGDTKYIVPIVCFTDEAEIYDERSEWQQDYIKLSILDTLASVIAENNTPLEKRLNLEMIDRRLKSIMVGSEMWLPVRH